MNAPAVGVVLHRVGQQVGQNLLHTRAVTLYALRVGRQVLADAYAAFARAVFHQRQGAREQRRQFQRLNAQSHIARLNARQIEHVVDHFQQVPTGMLNLAHPRPLRVGQRVALVQLQQLREAQHRVQWRAQLMAHARQEVALGVVGRLGRGARLLRFGQLHVVGDVFHRAHNAPRLALLIAQQRHRRLHPQRVAVARDVALVAAVQRNFTGHQLARQLGVLAYVVGVGEVERRHAQQLVGAVAGELAKARVGLQHIAAQVGVNHADGHVVQDVAKALLAFAQRALGLLALKHLLLQGSSALGHGRFDAPGAPGHRQQQGAQHAGGQHADDGKQPAVVVAYEHARDIA